MIERELVRRPDPNCKICLGFGKIQELTNDRVGGWQHTSGVKECPCVGLHPGVKEAGA